MSAIGPELTLAAPGSNPLCVTKSPERFCRWQTASALQCSYLYQALQYGGMDGLVTRCPSCGSSEFDRVRPPHISRVPIVLKSASLGQVVKRSSNAARQL